MKSVDVTLTGEELKALGEVNQLPLGYPAWLNALPPDRLPGQDRRFERT